MTLDFLVVRCEEIDQPVFPPVSFFRVRNKSHASGSYAERFGDDVPTTPRSGRKPRFIYVKEWEYPDICVLVSP